MPYTRSDIVHVSPEEHTAIRRALDAFLKHHPEFINSLDKIKITRKKHNFSTQQFIRKIYYPVVHDHGCIIYQTFNCPPDIKDRFMAKAGHSCTFKKYNGRIKMIFPQNKEEAKKSSYDENKQMINTNHRWQPTTAVKQAAIYDFQTKKKEVEIYYKSTKKRVFVFPQIFQSDQAIQYVSDLYWATPLHRVRDDVEQDCFEVWNYKTIELMIDAGNDMSQLSDDFNCEIVAWIMLVVFAELQYKNFIHGDLKPNNICYQRHPHTQKDENIMAIRFIDLEGVHLVNTHAYEAYTLGYVAPELFIPGFELPPQAQINYAIVKENINNNAPLTQATDCFAMAQTLIKILRGYLLSIELRQLITQMNATNPEDRPDLADCFEISTTRNPELAEYTLSDNQLKFIRYWGNINRLLTLSDPNNPVLAEKMRARIYRDRYFSQRVNSLRTSLESQWMSPRDIYHLAYPNIFTQLYHFIKSTAPLRCNAHETHSSPREKIKSIYRASSPDDLVHSFVSLRDEEDHALNPSAPPSSPQPLLIEHLENNFHPSQFPAPATNNSLLSWFSTGFNFFTYKASSTIHPLEVGHDDATNDLSMTP